MSTTILLILVLISGVPLKNAFQKRFPRASLAVVALFLIGFYTLVGAAGAVIYLLIP